MIVENKMAGRALQPLISALNGSAIQQKQSFLIDMIGEKIGSGLLSVTDDPFIVSGRGSRHFDNEGIATKKRTVIKNGVLKTYFIDTYYGKKLGMEPNSGSTTNLVFETGSQDLDGLLAGIDRGILVTVDSQFVDSRTTAQALKAAIEQDGTPDIIFAGKGAVDTEGFQTLYRLAAAMNLPVVNEINKMELGDGKATVGHEIGGGAREVVEVSLPCVLGATKGLNEPRYPKFPDIMKAKKKPVRR